MASNLEQAISLLQQMISTGEGRKNLENLISKFAPGFLSNNNSAGADSFQGNNTEVNNTGSESMVPERVFDEPVTNQNISGNDSDFSGGNFAGADQNSGGAGNSGGSVNSRQMGGLPGILATLGSPDFLNRVQSIFSNMQNDNSQRNNLMNALKPYLSARKQSKFDMAMQIMQLSNLPQFAKFFRR